MEAVIKNSQRVELDIEKCKTTKDKLLEFKVKELISDEDYTEQNNKLVAQMNNLKLSKESFSEINLDNAMKYAFEFLKTLPNSWKKLDVSELRVLNRILFPKNLSYSYPGFKTAELSSVYKVNQELNDKKESLAAPTGFEPVFVG